MYQTSIKNAYFCERNIHPAAMNQVITTIPIVEIRQLDTNRSFSRKRFLNKDAITQILQTQAVAFAVADVGLPLHWIKAEDTYTFWKQAAKNHLEEDLEQIDCDKFDGNYCYVASEWVSGHGDAIIVLEKYH